MTTGCEGESLNIEEKIKDITEFKYLGVRLMEGNVEKDILQKIGRGSAITRQLNSSLWRKEIRGKLNKYYLQHWWKVPLHMSQKFGQ